MVPLIHEPSDLKSLILISKGHTPSPTPSLMDLKP